MPLLDGRVALVTGGGTGLGRAVSLALAREGCSVAINYAHSESEARATCQETEALGGRALTVCADVTDDTAVRAMVEHTVATFGGLDILVNNAGTTRFASLEDLDSLTDDLWREILDVNLVGAFRCVRAAAPYLKQSGKGKIVNTASASAFRPVGSSIPYMASKAGLVSLTRSLARALAPDVQVNAVAPGWLDTRWLERYLPSDVRERVLAHGPTADVDEVARAVVMLASTDSISGDVIIIDRGQSL
jgi:3-oxoacyl-[acyl-carrier protein] reductase